MTSSYAELTRSFEARDLDPAAFRHMDHVGVAYEMLRKYDFLEAAARYGVAIGTIASEAGKPDKYNVTITFAFMSLIAERMETNPSANCADFLAQNRELLSKNVLRSWYSPDRLTSDLARRVFLMPDSPQ